MKILKDTAMIEVMNDIEAKDKALAHLKKIEEEIGEPLTLMDNMTEISDLGWAFYYQTKSFLDSGDPLEALAGNGPIFVKKIDGEVMDVGSYHSLTDFLNNLKS